jgi:hypothetical protein
MGASKPGPAKYRLRSIKLNMTTMILTELEISRPVYIHIERHVDYEIKYHIGHRKLLRRMMRLTTAYIVTCLACSY